MEEPNAYLLAKWVWLKESGQNPALSLIKKECLIPPPQQMQIAHKGLQEPQWPGKPKPYKQALQAVQGSFAMI